MRVGEHFANEENDCDGNTCADPVQDFEVEEEICHDFDDQTLENDICLLRLKGSLKMNSKCVNRQQGAERGGFFLKAFNCTSLCQTMSTPRRYLAS